MTSVESDLSLSPAASVSADDGRAHEAADVLRRGGLIALPTETVYGLAADARNARAVASIFATKGRPADHPLIVHLGHAQHMTRWARDIPAAAWALAEAFWPGPLTLVLPRSPQVLDAVTGGLDTVALRIPNHPLALSVLADFGDGVAAPSANRYGKVSPTTAEHVRDELGNAVEMILDGGPCTVGIESTIVDLTAGVPCILRPGAITADAVQQVAGIPVSDRPPTGARSPGLKASHYAPNARTVLVPSDRALHEVEHWLTKGQKVGLLAMQRPTALPAAVPWLALGTDVAEQARHLYRCLREADRLGLQTLVAVLPADVGLGRALRDRLQRAAGQGSGS